MLILLLALLSPIEAGRGLTADFYAGRTDALWKRMGDSMRAELKSSANLAAFAANVKDLLGREVELLDETADGATYLRTARFEKNAEPFRVFFSFDAQGRILDFWIRPVGNEVVYATKTPLRLPFDGEWIVASGGRTAALNQHHVDYPNRFACDFARAEDARFTIESPARRNEDYTSWGQPILAPAPGTVAAIADDTPDNNVPGRFDARARSTGNYVVIDHGNAELSLLGHLQHGSVRVRQGQRVTAGQVLGACGNSGKSNGPHLHYNLQNRARPGTGTGLPAQFLRYLANGVAIERGEPVTGQRVRNEMP